jgi:HSP20 family protein
MSVLRWDPFQDLLSLRDEMNRVFDRAWGQTTSDQTVRAWAPALDIAERKDAYLVTVELPGINPDDIDVTLENNLLTIQGQRHRAQDSSDQQFHRVERAYGLFRRSVSLPSTVQADAIQASYENGGPVATTGPPWWCTAPGSAAGGVGLALAVDPLAGGQPVLQPVDAVLQLQYPADAGGGDPLAGELDHVPQLLQLPPRVAALPTLGPAGVDQPLAFPAP